MKKKNENTFVLFLVYGGMDVILCRYIMIIGL